MLAKDSVRYDFYDTLGYTVIMTSYNKRTIVIDKIMPTAGLCMCTFTVNLNN